MSSNLFFRVGKWEKSVSRNTLRTITVSVQCSVLYANKVSQEYHRKKNILRITVRLACLPPAIHSPSDTDNKDKHNGIILMSLFSKEQHWQCDGNVQLADVLSPPHFPVPSLPNFSSDRCAIQAMSGCVLPSPLLLLLRDGFLVIFSSLSHPRMLGRQTPR